MNDLRRKEVHSFSAIEGELPRIRLLTIDQAATYLGTTRPALYSKVHRKEIPFVKIGRALRFDIRALDRWVNSQTSDFRGQGSGDRRLRAVK